MSSLSFTSVEIVDRQTPRAQSSGARFGLALSILSFILTLENMW